jgi:hypothetical protein
MELIFQGFFGQLFMAYSLSVLFPFNHSFFLSSYENDYDQVLEGKNVWQYIRWRWVQWLHYKRDSSQPNALAICSPDGWRRQNPVSIIVDESQVFLCIKLCKGPPPPTHNILYMKEYFLLLNILDVSLENFVTRANSMPNINKIMFGGLCDIYLSVSNSCFLGKQYFWCFETRK